MGVDIDNRTYQFAVRVLKMARTMPRDVGAQIVMRQVARSGTSIGANVEEAQSAHTKKEFTRRMNIANSESRETHYWLRLIRDSGVMPARKMGPIIQEADEIKRILSAIVQSSQRNTK